MRKFETVKLFYKKYAYKVVLYNQLSHIFREKKFEYTRRTLDQLQLQYEAGLELFISNVLRMNYIGNKCFVEAKKIYEILTTYKGDFKLRVENNFLTIYSNNERWLKKFHAFDPWEVHAPSADNLESLENNITFVNFKGYEYKVILSRSTPEFAKWLEANKSSVRVGKRAYHNITEHGYCAGNYFYVKNDKALFMIKLLLTDCIQRIDTLKVNPKVDK